MFFLKKNCEREWLHHKPLLGGTPSTSVRINIPAPRVQEQLPMNVGQQTSGRLLLQKEATCQTYGIPYIYILHIHSLYHIYIYINTKQKQTLPLQRCCCKKVFKQFLWLMWCLLFVCNNCLSQMFMRNSTPSQPQIGPFMTSQKIKLRDQSFLPKKKIMTQCFYIAQSLVLFFGVVYGRYGMPAGQN